MISIVLDCQTVQSKADSDEWAEPVVTLNYGKIIHEVGKEDQSNGLQEVSEQGEKMPQEGEDEDKYLRYHEVVSSASLFSCLEILVDSLFKSLPKRGFNRAWLTNLVPNVRKHYSELSVIHEGAFGQKIDLDGRPQDMKGRNIIWPNSLIVLSLLLKIFQLARKQPDKSRNSNSVVTNLPLKKARKGTKLEHLLDSHFSPFFPKCKSQKEHILRQHR